MLELTRQKRQEVLEVIGVDQYQFIRHAYAVEGLSQREIARRLGISRNTVKKYVEGDSLPMSVKSAERNLPVIGPVKNIILGYLEEDRKNNLHKQRHTAKRIYDRLCKEHGFTGGYSTVRQCVRQLKQTSKVFIPLEFDPGEAAQVDWGTAIAYINGQRTVIQLFCMRLCHSAAIFVAAFPTQRYESFLMGHRLAFEFFGGVPRRLIYDNVKTAVKEGWGKHVTQEQVPFQYLKAHYAFISTFCNPGQGNEKGLVENLVGFSRRNVLVPVPRVGSWEELQNCLIQYSRDYLNHKIQSRPAPVSIMLAEEKAYLTSLPKGNFECAITKPAKVRDGSLIQFDHNEYSLPVHLIGQEVTVKGYPLTVEIWQKSIKIVTHRRSYQRGEVCYELAHYLPALEKKPRAIANAAPVRRSGLPPEIIDFRQHLAGKNADRDFVAILKLTVQYGQDAVLVAIRKAQSSNHYSVEAVRFHLLQAVHRQVEQQPDPIPTDPNLPRVMPVNLKQYDTLMKGRK